MKNTTSTLLETRTITVTPLRAWGWKPATPLKVVTVPAGEAFAVARSLWNRYRGHASQFGQGVLVSIGR